MSSAVKCSSCKQVFEPQDDRPMCPRCIEWNEDTEKPIAEVECPRCAGKVFREERWMSLQDVARVPPRLGWPVVTFSFVYICVGCGRKLENR